MADVFGGRGVTRRAAMQLAGGSVLGVGVAGAAGGPASADGGPVQPDGTSRYVVGSFLVDVGTGADPMLRIVHRAEPQRVIWSSPATGGFVQTGTARTVVEENDTPASGFTITDRDLVRFEGQTVDAVSASGGVLTLSGRLTAATGETRGYTVTLSAAAERRLQLRITPTGGSLAADRVFLRYASDPGETFWGFGAQMTYADQKGRLLPILVQEHGVGRGLPVITEIVAAQAGPRTAGNPLVSEIVVPQYVTNRARSLFLENTEYCVFDLRAAYLVEVESFSAELTGQIVYGRTPLELVETYTEYAGRMRPLPDWVHSGAIVCAQGGTAKVDGVVTTLADAEIPVAALWVQDWTGVNVTDLGKQVQWNWVLSPTQYDGWRQLQRTFSRRLGARTVLYVNPFLSMNPGHDQLFQEARSKGYLVMKGADVYLIPNSFPAALVDLSDPEARAWVKGVIRTNLVGNGASGWMADFGEALPFDSTISGGDPSVWHNRYTEEWARLNREVLEENRLGDDGLFFTRSGYTRSPGVSTLFWVGDQLQTWDAFDGLRSAITGCISAGFSGFSLTHSDIGGFDSLGTTLPGTDIRVTAVHRTKELLLRWAEHSAFTAVMRSHQGIDPSVAWQVDEDLDTLLRFRRTVQLYQAWDFYRRKLVDEAARTGRPVIRAMGLQFPDDPTAATQQFQYMLGDTLLVAPVTAPAPTVKPPGTRPPVTAQAYLPPGSWEHVWSGTRYAGGGSGRTVTVSAEIGYPPLFLRTDSGDAARLRRQLRAVPAVAAS